MPSQLWSVVIPSHLWRVVSGRRYGRRLSSSIAAEKCAALQSECAFFVCRRKKRKKTRTNVGYARMLCCSSSTREWRQRWLNALSVERSVNSHRVQEIMTTTLFFNNKSFYKWSNIQETRSVIIQGYLTSTIIISAFSDPFFFGHVALRSFSKDTEGSSLPKELATIGMMGDKQMFEFK